MRRGADPWQAAGFLRMSVRRAAVFLNLPDLYLWRLRGPADMSQALYGLPPPTNAIRFDVRVGSKLRNTQHEQMSSALPPRADIGLAAPKHYADRVLRHIEPSNQLCR